MNMLLMPITPIADKHPKPFVFKDWYNKMVNDDNPIVTFESPHRMHDMGIGETTSDDVCDHPIDNQLFNIRLVNSDGRREAASLLINKKYAWRGYSIDSPLDKVPNRITLVAETGGKTVGTMTLCLDGEIKLPADENFRDKLDELRAQGCRVSEPSRLAIDDNVPKRVFASLIHIAYIYAHNILGFTDWVIEVNPRHAMFYKKMLGFNEIGEERVCTRVNAPAVLLKLELKYMSEQIQKFGGLMEKHGKEKSFYPYFFPRWDEPGITNRLMTGRT
ncbi:MAG: long-chain N-acyl amino acid synthase [Candidatus Nitrotoga sp.]|nr:long-chain N-acyl amino acid synthase [Candidatus Nitrotoga sp.]